MEIILLEEGGITKLAKKFRVSRQTASKALRGKSDTSVSRMLRKAALENGGKLLREVPATEGYVPECETAFDNVHKTMTQTFGSRVKLIADLSTGTVDMYIDGKVQHTYQNVTLQQLADIQASAEQAANQ